MPKSLFRFLLVLLVPALGLGCCLVFALRVPFLGMLVGLAAYPLLTGFPESGADVEYGFAWLIVKSPRAFLIFLLYYSAVCYAILLPCGLVIRRNWQPRQNRRPTPFEDW